MSSPIGWISRIFHRVFLLVFEVLNIPLDLLTTLLKRTPPYWKAWQKFTKLPKGIRAIANAKWGKIFSDLDDRGHYLSTLVLNRVPAEQLQALLPKGLELRPEADGKHPVVYAFGFMENCIPDWVPLSGMDYLEMMVSIPNVYVTGATEGYAGPFLYMPRLHLNHIYPCILGWMAGYAKRWSRIQTTNDTYRVGTLLTNKEILRAKFQCQGEIGKPHDFKAFEPWQPLANQPAVTDLFGMFMYVFFFWEWEEAVMQGVSAEIFPPAQAKFRVPGLDYGRWPGINEGEHIAACRIDVPFEFAPSFNRMDLKPRVAAGAKAASA